MYELRQLVGKRAIGNGTETVKQPIDEILKKDATKRNGYVRLGFVSRHDGAPVSFTRHGLSDGEKHEAFEAVKKLRAERDLKTSERFSAIPTIPDELLESELAEVDDE